MKIQTTGGHLTATEKRHISAILCQGLTSGTVNRKTYHITKEGEEYTVKVMEMGRGLGFIGEPLRLCTSTKKFKLV